MANRIAPSSGYAFPAKSHYRKSVWSKFAYFAGTDRKSSKAILMPSLEGDEIEAALDAGFRPSNLIAVDKNPAIVAHLRRRWPAISTHGVDVAEAARRIAKSGDLVRLANLDLCGKLSSKTLNTIEAFMASRVLFNGLISITCLRGREQKEDLDRIDEASMSRMIAMPLAPHQAYVNSPYDPESTRDHGRIMVLLSVLSGERGGIGTLGSKRGTLLMSADYDERYQVRNAETERALRSLAELLDERTPEGWAWGVFLVPFGVNEAAPKGNGAVFWMSNADRAGMVDAVQGWIDEQRRRADGHANS